MIVPYPTCSPDRSNPMLAAIAACMLASSIGHAQVTGPLVGQVSASDARFLYRSNAVERPFRVTVLTAAGAVAGTSGATSLAANDYVAKFHVTGLQPNTAYRYKLEDLGGGAPVLVAGADDDHRFRTFLPVGMRGALTAAFLSCADATSDILWQRIDSLGVDQLYLMGDTPYIDTTDLATVRQKHRDFLNRAPLAILTRHTPTVGTWDDHDFGLNNGNGLTVTGKANTRQAFVEYRAHDQYGTGTEGVYSKVNHGPLEVFLLDPRWFSQTDPSPVDPSQKTCFGSAQWSWIRDALRTSKATFKVVAMGQIWQDKKNTETDDMFTYWYERDALLDFIRDEQIPGVVLLGGDIHLARHLIHPRRIGYDLHDFVTSPAHSSTIASLDVYHPSLEWSLIEPRQFLTMTADTRVQPPRLTVRYILDTGEVKREVIIPYDQLVPRHGEGLGLDLRAWWPFDGSFANQSPLGPRANASPVNGASVAADGGLRGGAASFNRVSSQYLHVPRSILHDNSAAHTVSLWCKAATLPAHGSVDRLFLLESTADGTVTAAAGYGLSLGFRTAASDSSKINLELHTHTLQPAASTSTAPTAIAQGGFATELPRSLFLDRWTHVVVTFDASKLRLFIDGNPVSQHNLPIPGPLSETGGLVIGGHRNGTGRNFEGLIDEVALWSRVLVDAEISSLHSDGTPEALPATTSVADTDGDTLPDWWETMHDLDPTLAVDAVADDDRDGVPAFLEFRSGTSPMVDDSPLYTTLRAIACPHAAAVPLGFRHPSLDQLRLRLALHESVGLTGWSAADLDVPGTTVTADDDALVVRRPASPATTRFLRFETKAASP